MAPNVITHCQAVVRWERAVRRLCKVLSAHQLAVMGSIQVFQLKIMLCESQYAFQRSLFHTTRITLYYTAWSGAQPTGACLCYLSNSLYRCASAAALSALICLSMSSLEYGYFYVSSSRTHFPLGVTRKCPR